MKLSSLRLFGFKTFAQATTLNFDANVIAIVGPNGSGKSNLVDAIRWVLGEQSTKSLRSAKTDDIIFAGNAKRKPLGMAEVSLTFDNSEGKIDLPFKEIQITRRAYRAGDIEYYLNKERVRLRDVHELLMGTGLGPGSYAIVSQGQIDQILVSKPSERRALFEETAGVNKFLARKAEAMRRLDGTNANVVRLNDVLREVESRIPELDSAVRRATKYRNVGARLRDLEILASVRACDSRKTALDEARRQADQNAAQLRETSTAANAAEEILTNSRTEYTLAERVFEQSRTAHEASRALLSNVERDVATARARLETLESQANSAEGESRRRLDEREHLSARLAAAEAELAPLDAAVIASAEAERAASEALQQARLQAEKALTDVREYESRANALLAESTKARGARETAERDLERATTELQRTTDECVQLDEAARNADTQLADVRSARETQREAAAHAEIALTGAQARQQKAAEQLPQAQADLRNVTRELASLEARLHTLEELDANLDGHVPGTRAIMEASVRGDVGGIIGVVSSLVDVDENYARALDVAFGAGVSNIIAESSHSAEAAIEYLRSRELGRATLLPLDLVASRRGKDLGPLSRTPGVIAYAHELVRTEERFSGVVAFLVGRTLVVDTMRTGVRLAREQQVRDTIVTLEGDQLIGGGAMSGGRSRRGERSILARRAEAQTIREEHLPALREAVADAEADLARASAELDAATAERDRLRRALDECKTVLRECDVREQSVNAQFSQAQGRVAQLQRRRDELSQSAATARERLEALPTDTFIAERDDAERERLEGVLRAARTAIGECEAATNAARAASGSARERASMVRMQTQTMKAQLEMTAADVDRQSDRRESVLGEITVLRERLAETTVNHEAARAEAEIVAAAMREAQQARDTLARTINETERAARFARAAEREQLESGEAVRRRVAELEAELGLLQQRFAESPIDETEKVEILARYADAPASIVDEVPKLRDDLARLANNVNLNAETEREELGARETELRGQLDDFAKARELLLGTIGELDKTSQEQFLKTFDVVRGAFNETYTELFPGGEARMWLADPENPNGSGIEISVRPPGKRMTSLAALSGGERAMTAVALIFALIRVKPSPFYLLDEIDAALDEMNVERFSRMVHTLSAESQLLIVTHNKKTMELAQKMYGITMAEPGMSSVVTASLDREKSRELTPA